MNLYEKLDSALMEGVNSGVRAWNWTTGRTKADLANLLLGVTPILDSMSQLVEPNPSKYAMLALLLSTSSIYAHYQQKRNSAMEKIEAKALESNAKSMDVERYNQNNKGFQCPYWMGLGGVLTAMPSKNCSNQFIGASDVMRGLSFYVMRADYLPPKKNCLSRAMDKVSDAIAQASQVPVPVPVRYLENAEAK